MNEPIEEMSYAAAHLMRYKFQYDCENAKRRMNRITRNHVGTSQEVLNIPAYQKAAKEFDERNAARNEFLKAFRAQFATEIEGDKKLPWRQRKQKEADMKRRVIDGTITYQTPPWQIKIIEAAESASLQFEARAALAAFEASGLTWDCPVQVDGIPMKAVKPISRTMFQVIDAKGWEFIVRYESIVGLSVPAIRAAVNAVTATPEEQNAFDALRAIRPKKLTALNTGASAPARERTPAPAPAIDRIQEAAL